MVGITLITSMNLEIKHQQSRMYQFTLRTNKGTMKASAYGFLAGLGQKISARSGDDHETCYLFQRISV